jgi:hypothetical protein
MKKSKFEDQCRVFEEKMGKQVFSSVVRDKIVCLICNKRVQVRKENNLRRHYKTLHKDKFGVLEGELREDKLKNFKSDLKRQQNIFTVATKSNEATVFMQILLFHK